LIGHEGIHSLFSAHPGQSPKQIFIRKKTPSIGIVKDGAGVGRVMLLPEKSSVLGTIQMVVPKANTDLLYLVLSLKSMNLSNDEANVSATIPHIYFKKYGLMKEFSIPKLWTSKSKLAVNSKRN
jgi:type I restriction enzyme S subunit